MTQFNDEGDLGSDGFQEYSYLGRDYKFIFEDKHILTIKVYNVTPGSKFSQDAYFKEIDGEKILIESVKPKAIKSVESFLLEIGPTRFFSFSKVNGSYEEIPAG